MIGSEATIALKHRMIGSEAAIALKHRMIGSEATIAIKRSETWQAEGHEDTARQRPRTLLRASPAWRLPGPNLEPRRHT
jgi:hypothetical protein